MTRPTRVVLAGMGLLALAACGGPSSGTFPFSSSSAQFTADQLIGTWAMELSDSIACPESLTNRTLSVGVAGDAGDVGAGGSLTFTSLWSADPDPGGGVAGTVDLVTGQMSFRLFRDGYSQAADLTGVIGSDGVFVGTLTDPYAGYPALFDPAGCTVPVRGARVAAP